ncbi:MAG: hypothetical protein AAFU53_06725 [Cyanobacteria bacterium J06632_3]
MTPTTQPKPSIPSVAKSTSPQRRLRFNTFGFKLFSVIMGGALISIAGVTFLFSETVKNQAEEQIQKILEGKVGTIHEVTDRAETLADSLGISVATLHVRRAETPETFQELTRKLFEKHPDYVVGLGFGQKENGILPSAQWFYPYYQTASADSSDIRYVNRAAQPYFYPQSEAYQQYFLPQKDLWTAPYQSNSPANSSTPSEENRRILLTYYSQIFDNDNEWLGTAVVDVDSRYLSDTIDGPVYSGGGQLILASENGSIIANPANPENIEQQTFNDIPGLAEIWSQINTQTNEKASGLIEGESGYWSYASIPEQSWIVFAYVPYRAVFGRIVFIALSAVLPAGLLMAGLTALAIRYLNQRLRPVINECQRLSTEDTDIETKLYNKDELEQLSLSFFNLLDQLKLTKTKVQLEAAHATEVKAQLNQIKAKSAAEQQQQQSTVSQAQDYVLSIADVMLTAHQDVRTQTELIDQLQQHIASVEPLTKALNQQIARLSNEVRHTLATIPNSFTGTPQELTADLTATKAAVLTLATQLKALSDTAQSAHHTPKSHQSIFSTAQVLLANASTLAISASRPQNPETHEEIVNQLRSKGQSLKDLAEQLKSTQLEQQQNSTRVSELAANLDADINTFISTFDKAIQQLHTDSQSTTAAQPQLSQKSQPIHAISQQAIAANQKLTEQISPLRQNLQQLETLTNSLSERVSFTLRQTQQVNQIQLDRPVAISSEKIDTH